MLPAATLTDSAFGASARATWTGSLTETAKPKFVSTGIAGVGVEFASGPSSNGALSAPVGDGGTGAQNGVAISRLGKKG